MPSKEVMIFIKDAKYYQSNDSLVITGVEVETKKPITQQILVSAFAAAIGLPPESVNDHTAWVSFASQLKHRSQPFRLVFEDSIPEGQNLATESNRSQEALGPLQGKFDEWQKRKSME
jgi:hypothetical protein